MAALTQEVLQRVVDRALQDVIPQVGGITLLQGGSPPCGELYTVHTVFDGEAPLNLAFCADAHTFARITRNMMGQEQVEPEDLCDAAKEFFNIFCGHVAVELYQVTRKPFRFRIPRFGGGRHVPKEYQWQFVLNYTGDQKESMQLLQHAGVAEKD